MYKAVRTYTLRPGTCEEFLRRVEESFVPLISHLPGFIAYDAHRIAKDRVITVSTFETRVQAEESILLALRWVQEHTLELMQGLPLLSMDQVLAASEPARFLDTHPHHVEKALVLDLRFEVLHPSTLGEQAYSDPRVGKMVADIRTFLTQMRADPTRYDDVIYRFDRDIRPEEATRSLYTADHVLLFKRGDRLVGYGEINRDRNAWLGRDRYEGDILVDPAAYQRDEGGMRVEKGIGEQGLLEMRRQGRLLRIKNIELDVYRGNQSMHHFLNHLIKTHRLPLVEHEMTYGRPLDSTYLIPC
jgi:Antibiotic biosynthesis monooxygenase